MKSKETKVKCDEHLQHIAFIMDGNGRWAKKRGLPRQIGHSAGAKTFRKIIEYCGDIGIKIITVYAFSTENWKRPKVEVQSILKLLNEYTEEALIKANSRSLKVVFIGDKEPFDPEMRALMDKLEETTANNPLRLNIALNYGGRAEIVHAVNTLIADGKKSVTEEDINSALYTKDCPPPDLIVRTAGELRISNFLLWQSAYSELYFTDVLWPDMNEKEIDAAVDSFYNRVRRYGAVV